MAPVAMVFGVLLIVLGIGGYVATDRVSVTALIPAFVGLPLVLLGFVALKDNLRKHAMHAAAALGLLGFLGAAGQLIRKLIGGEAFQVTAGFISQVLMALLCAVFVGLCVKSFIDARRARAKKAEEGASPSAV